MVFFWFAATEVTGFKLILVNGEIKQKDNQKKRPSGKKLTRNRKKTKGKRRARKNNWRNKKTTGYALGLVIKFPHQKKKGAIKNSLSQKKKKGKKLYKNALFFS